ncbi:branched-chain amino acid transport system substrate-binding protein [Lutimaribacter pacificus]|uniref:Amino acid/amide ABC transporter substrate-binding protein, HAAT family n=1 Tax=Lutimaribacter pacificus TaxID=391948 RepID=A0A1H0ITT1_9RHOB|nr:ABC transporter substrate-binding protein [Lutimaribacter pacificus]SDO34894.1 branched-chain amino acid transport system substrate-binding protein [Lutimaribacter pacificus]SHK17569.1 amino acid/amide ABC transporter substrate-binding protein, HAAT family [Lutimaribacter pacificus]
MKKKLKLSRRSFLSATAAASGMLAAPSVVRAASREIRIGYITALSGPRAEFGASDPWMLEQVRRLTENGLTIGGNTYSVEFLMRDNQSNINRSASVGQELIQREGVDLLLVQDLDASVATGEMSDIAGVPSISTIGPWQAWMYGRGSTPEQGFPYSFTFFWGADDAMGTFPRIWDQIDTNRVVGDFYFDNSAGQAFSDPNIGLPAIMEKAGYSRIDGGRFQLETQDFSAQVSRFKAAEAQIVTGFGFPPHWSTFWAQAGQMGFAPEAATFAGAFLFPSAIDALGDRGNGMSTEVWWTPKVPFHSSLTGQSAAELAQAYEDQSGAQWIQTLGYSHALFETGLAALTASGDPKNPDAVRDAIAALDIATMVGPVNFAGSPIRNVAVTEVAGGQWRKTTGGRHEYDLVITENALAPSIGVEDTTLPLSQLG